MGFSWFYVALSKLNSSFNSNRHIKFTLLPIYIVVRYSNLKHLFEIEMPLHPVPTSIFRLITEKLTQWTPFIITVQRYFILYSSLKDGKHFFELYMDRKLALTLTFLQLFTGSQKSTRTFWIDFFFFSRVDFDIYRWYHVNSPPFFSRFWR